MRFRLMAFGLGVLAAGSVVEAAVFSLKAVKKNGTPITPTASLSVLGGDKIEAEIFLSGWLNDFPPPIPPNPAGVRSFQAKINGTGYVSGTNGKVVPDGWCAPVGKIECTDSSTCPAAYPFCDLNNPITHNNYGCDCGAGQNPKLGALMTRSRTDFLFNGIDITADIALGDLYYAYVAVATQDAVVDTGVPRYLGTLILKVSANACGTFRIGFLDDQQSNLIGDASVPANTSYPTGANLQPLVLTVRDDSRPGVDVCARLLVSCNPAHCNEDARIAHDRLDQSIRLNANTIVMNYTKPTAGMTAADFEFAIVPFVPSDPLPSINSVTPSGNSATVVLNRRIQQTRWFCFRDIGSDRRCCMGSLPGDADDSRVSSRDADKFEIVDNLNGVVSPVLAIEKCDTDRSLLCTPADLLMVVDLFNGADAFDPVQGNTLQTCPVFNLSQQ